MVSRLIRVCVAFYSAAAMLQATTTLTSVATTNTQAVLRITTDQSGTCTIRVSEVNDFSSYAPVEDVNPAFFSNADQCGRPGNIDEGTAKLLMVGKRAAELASDGKTRYSRALQANTTYYFQIASGADVLAGEFTTRNVPLGNTRNDPHFDRARPGEYAYPTIDWTDKAVKYVDPTTGIAVRRASGPGEIFPVTSTGRTFSTPVVLGVGWTISGSSVYAGSGPGEWLYLRAGTLSPGFTLFQSLDSVRLATTLSGSADGVEVCLTNDGVTCSGATISQAVTGTPTAYTIGSATPILDNWRNSPNIPSNMVDVIPRVGNITKSGTAVTWNSGDIFNPHWSAGSHITLGATDCEIASVTHEKTVVLVSSGCVADGDYDYTGRNWGFLLRTTTSGNLTVAAAPTWTTSITGVSLMGAFGVPKFCSSIKVTGPTGPGHVCSTSQSVSDYTSGVPFYWFGDDGTTNLVGLNFVPSGGGLDSGFSCIVNEGMVWDDTVPGKWWCIGASGGAPVIYSVVYTGDYSAAFPALDAVTTSVNVTVESTNINTMVTSFSSGDTYPFSAFTCGGGWKIMGRQAHNLMLYCWERSQESPAWLAVYSMDSSSIIAAMSTYGGVSNSANRWCGLHTPSIAGDTEWYGPITCNATDLNFETGIASGTLTSSLSACPVNTVDPSLNGVEQCSTVTLDSLTPLHSGLPLYSQSFELGDSATVLSGGSFDTEIVRILAFPGGNQVTLQRGYRVYVYGLNYNHSGSLSLRAFTGVWNEFWWQFVDDPHGQRLTKPYGLTVRPDPDSSNCHEVYAFGIFLVGCEPFSGLSWGAAVRTGELPGNFDNYLFRVNWDAAFAGSTYVISTTFNEDHPWLSQYNASDYEKLHWLTARPYMGDPAIAQAADISSVTGYVHKLAASATSGLQYRKQGFIGLTGALPMVDVSPAVITNTTTDHFRYCVVVIANDCYASSTAGEIYFNVPFLTNAYSTHSRFVNYPVTTLRDVSFTQNTDTVGNYIQVSALRQDFAGTGIRRLTTGFAAYKLQSAFWNGRTLPDGKRFFWGTSKLEGARDELLIADLPPYPPQESTNRGDFVPVTLTIGGFSGDEVRVRFGYAENGPATSLYCHERQTACATDATGSQPFLWVDETQHWTACDSGCSVDIRAISGRVLYYVVDRKNAGVTVSSPMDVVAEP
ncbi:MAG: hypothetical protein ABI811_18535 [Acidobacteriota bacterium]